MSLSKLIGAYRYPGWADNSAPDLPGWGTFPVNRTTYADRKPLLGWYDEAQQSVMDAQIKMAKAAEIDFFTFDWYYSHVTKAPAGDHALKNFLASSVEGMKCCIGFDSAANAPVASASDWFDIIELWVQAFESPKYLRVDGRPVVFILKLDSFEQVIAPAAGMTHKQLLDTARTRSGENIYFVACSAAALEFWLGVAHDSGYDCYSAYNFFTTWTQRWGTVVPGPKPTSYSQLAAIYKTEWRYLLGSPSAADKTIWTGGALQDSRWKIDLWLPMTAGFDNTPWPPITVAGCMATPSEFRSHLQDALPLLECPQTIGGIICAWDEIGEGSIIQPSYKLGREMVSQVKQVFKS